jgi:hypothetical protein
LGRAAFGLALERGWVSRWLDECVKAYYGRAFKVVVAFRRDPSMRSVRAAERRCFPWSRLLDIEPKDRK